MKILSWNVNGIRAVFKKGFEDSILKINPDILCIQETKAEKKQLDYDFCQLGYEHSFWNSAEKKGYSGTLILSKTKPINISLGLEIEKHDKEGRVITAEYDNFFLINVYTPNSKRGLLRLDYRQKEWDADFLEYMNKLKKIKEVIVCGDLNVAPEEIDLKNDKSNHRNAGFTDEERNGFRNYLKNGFLDAFRFLYPEKEQYTWWSYMGKAREKNVGWRIDHFLLSDSIIKKVSDVIIHDQVLGSDHCPIEINMEI